MHKVINIIIFFIFQIVFTGCDSSTNINGEQLTSKEQLLGKWSNDFQKDKGYNNYLEFKDNDSVSLIFTSEGFIDSMELPYEVIGNDFYIYDSLNDTTLTYKYFNVQLYDDILNFSITEENGDIYQFACKKVATFPDFYDNWQNYSLEEALQQYVDAQIEKEYIFNSTLLIDAPDYNFFWKGASGNCNDTTQMQPNDLFRIASIGKTFTASIIMLLYEENRLKLNDTISKFLPDSVTDSIHIYNNKCYGPQITIQQLLQHTSGIADYLDDDFDQYILESPYKHKTIYDILHWTESNKSSAFPPGTEFLYSDVNFLFLGLIIESIEKKTFNEVLKERIFDPLGMNNSFLEGFNDKSTPFSNTYYNDINAHDFDLSFDWSAGGIISNTEDLNTFIKSIVSGSLFRNPDTKNLMQNWISTDTYNSEYGFGLERYGFSLGRTFELIGHTGAFSSLMLYLPDYNITICGTHNQYNSNETEFIIGILNIVNQKLLGRNRQVKRNILLNNNMLSN